MKSDDFHRCTLATLVFCLFVAASSFADDMRFDHVTEGRNIYQGGIICLLQDSRGYIWFGTLDGLYRFDGYDFRVFKYNRENPDSISDSSITALCEP